MSTSFHSTTFGYFRELYFGNVYDLPASGYDFKLIRGREFPSREINSQQYMQAKNTPSGSVCSRKSQYSSDWRDAQKASGFTLIELLVVVAIAVVVAAFAVPNIVSTLDAVKLRGNMTSNANLVQRARTQAIRKNVTQRIHFTTVNNDAVVFVTDSTDANVKPVPTDPLLGGQVWFPMEFKLWPGLPAGPTALTGQIMWGSALAPNVAVDPYFNSRGLPCLPDPVTGVCNPTTGFVYYFKYRHGGAGPVRWAATSVSPAGRIESWFWNGNAWGN